MMNFLFCASMLQSFQGAFLRSPNSVTGKTVDINGKQQRRGRQTRTRRQNRRPNRRQKRNTQKPRQGRGFLCSLGLGNCDKQCGYINGVELTNGTDDEKFKTTDGFIKLDGSHKEFVRIELNEKCNLKLSGNGSSCDVFLDNYGDSVKETTRHNFKDLIEDPSRGKYGGIWYKAFWDEDKKYDTYESRRGYSKELNNCRFNQNNKW